jgi:CheY-like chemotaxis protein
MARLLIVEDHPELASLMVAAAESRGHEAQAVHTGEAALALLRPAAFHAAIVDLLLPDMRGSTVLSALRDHAIPAVAVSGVFKGDRFAREATEVHGARAFFEKPFELLQLLEAVEQLCGLTRPLPPPPPDDEDEVVVFEDASLLDGEDEPVFGSFDEDEPVFTRPPPPPRFIPPSQELTPVVMGLALAEEAEDPMRDEAPAPAPTPQASAPTPEPLPPPPPETSAAPPPAESVPPPSPETSAAPITVEVSASGEPEPALIVPEEEPHEEAPVPGVDEPEPAPQQEQERVPAGAEPAVVEATRPVTLGTDDLEELGVLDALNAEEAPAPAQAVESEARTESAEVTPEPGLALPFGEREKVWAKTQPAATPGPRRPSPPEWSLSGDLKDTSIPRLLNAYYEARHSGELKLKQGSVLKVIYFEAGRPVYAASNLAHERFARFCVRRGVLPEARLQEVLTLAREQNLRSAEAMIRLGVLDAKQRQQLVEEQVKEILWSTFSWTEGNYGFSPMRPPRAGLVKLAVFPGDLILEGILKSEPLVKLRQHMHRSRRLFPSAAPPYALHELKLKGQQALLLAYADGSKTVEDLLTLTELPERDVLATLRGLELIGVLEERRDEPTNRSRISFGL